MSTDTQNIVNKAWNFAHVLRDDGLSYMAYTEQITFLLFLKMADEQTRPPYNRKPIVPPELGWPSLLEAGRRRTGGPLPPHPRRTRQEAGDAGRDLQEGPARDPESRPLLKRLIVDLIDPEQWSSMEADVKGDIYEGLLARDRRRVAQGGGPILHAP